MDLLALLRFIGTVALAPFALMAVIWPAFVAALGLSAVMVVAMTLVRNRVVFGLVEPRRERSAHPRAFQSGRPFRAGVRCVDWDLTPPFNCEHPRAEEDLPIGRRGSQQ